MFAIFIFTEMLPLSNKILLPLIFDPPENTKCHRQSKTVSQGPDHRPSAGIFAIPM